MPTPSETASSAPPKAWPAGQKTVATRWPTAETARAGTPTPRPANGNVTLHSQGDYHPHSRAVVALRGDERPAPEAQPQPARNGTNSQRLNSTNGTMKRQRSKQQRRGAAYRFSQPTEPRPRSPESAKPPREQSYYPKIVEYVFDNRFVTGENIHDRFPQVLGSPRTTRRHTRALVTLGYLAIADLHDDTPTRPHVFTCTATGIGVIPDRRGGAGIEEATSPLTITHELILSQFGIDVCLSLPAHFELPLYERHWSSCTHPLTYTAADGQVRILLPDLAFVERRGQGPDATMLVTFVELDRGTESLPAVRAKFAAYEQWWASGGPGYLRKRYTDFGLVPRKPDFRPPWRLLIIAHDAKHPGPGRDHQRQLSLATLALEHRAVRANAWLTTLDELEAHVEDSPPLAAPLWRRTRDVVPLLAQYRKRTGVALDRPSRFQQRRHVVEQHLAGPGTWSLFPPA